MQINIFERESMLKEWKQISENMYINRFSFRNNSQNNLTFHGITKIKIKMEDVRKVLHKTSIGIFANAFNEAYGQGLESGKIIFTNLFFSYNDGIVLKMEIEDEENQIVYLNIDLILTMNPNPYVK